jgi:hypothetical protein
MRSARDDGRFATSPSSAAVAMADVTNPATRMRICMQAGTELPHPPAPLIRVGRRS